MIQENPTAFPGRCSTLANRDGHHKGYDGNQMGSEFLNTRTDTTTRNLSTHHLHLKHHKICHQVNRQKLNEVMDVLMQHLRYHQIYMYACTISTHLRDCLTYMRQITTHTLDYVDAATTSILSADILPVEELRAMLRHMEVQQPLIMYLPISLDNTLHLYRYLKTHILVEEGQLLLLKDVPIQDRPQQLQIYEIFNLPVPHGDVSAKYKVNGKYLWITYDEMQTIVITE